jgi:acyl carrier protein
VKHVERALSELPDTTLVNGYGPTETTTFAAYHLIQRDTPNRPSIPIGRPLANTRLYVLDAGRHPVTPGRPGELWIGGDGLAVGYLDDAELTADRFVRDPFTESPTRMYRSGDRARLLPNGALEFLGRIDNQLKVRGVRVEPAEIETALMAHPGVERAAVTVHDVGAAGRTLVAFVVATTPDAPPAAADLKAFLRSRLPERIVPHYYERLVRLPLLPNGKLDRRALRARLPSSSGSRRVADDRVLTDSEQAVAEVWRALLRVESIGSDSNFFELGGDSLLAVQAASRVIAATGAHMTVGTLFEFPTVSGLAKALEARGGTFSRDTPVQMHAPDVTNVAGASREADCPAPARGGLDVGQIESALSEIWRGVLDVPAVDPDDNFFELGGHSLMAVRVMAELEARLGVALSPATLFQHATIREQCQLILQPDVAGGSRSSSKLRRPSDGDS